MAISWKLKRDCTIYIVKTMALISCAVTAQLICAFVFADAKSMFSHGAAQTVNTQSSNFFSLRVGQENTSTAILTDQLIQKGICLFIAN